jgi:alkylglycerol monooxygenase
VISQAKTWNPLWANFRYYRDLYRTSKSFPNFFDRVKIWIKPPEWRPTGDLTAPEVDPRKVDKYDVTPVPSTTPWLWTQFGLCLVLYLFATLFTKELSYWHQAWLIGLTIWGLTNLGAMLETKSWRMISQGLFFFALMMTPFTLLFFK